VDFEEGVEGGWGCGGESVWAGKIGSRHVDIQAISRVRFGSDDASDVLRWRRRERESKTYRPQAFSTSSIRARVICSSASLKG
jgi:hypothetical protein